MASPVSPDLVLDDAPAPRGMRHAFRALRYPDFAKFWSGALVSNVGNWMHQTTVLYVLFHMTGSAAWVGLAAFCQFFPMMAMNAVGGVLADRVDRKRILLATQTALMVIAFSYFALWEAGEIRPGVLIALVALGGVVAGIQQPTWHSFVPQLVPRTHLLNAVALNSAQFNAARAVGPAIAGVVLVASGPGAAFLVNALTFVFVLFALASVRATQPVADRQGGGFRGEFGAAIEYARGHAAISLGVALVAVTSLLGAPVVQFTPVFAREFGVDELGYGLLGAAFGAGAVSGLLVVGGYGEHIPRSRLAVLGMLGLGAGAVALAVAPVYAVGLIALTVMGAAALVVVSALSTSIQLAVREEMRGRVMALFMMAFTGGFPLGALVQGRLADAFGVEPTVGVAGGVLVLVAGWLWTRPARMRTLDGGAAQAAGTTTPAVAPGR